MPFRLAPGKHEALKKIPGPAGEPGKKVQNRTQSELLFVLDRRAHQLDGDGVDTADAVHLVVDADVGDVVGIKTLEGFFAEGLEGGIAQIDAGEEAGEGLLGGDAGLHDGVVSVADIADQAVEGDGGEEVRAHGDGSGHAVVGSDASAASDDGGGEDGASSKDHLFHLRVTFLLEVCVGWKPGPGWSRFLACGK